jgi:DNA-nicking Smr family endonuclease
MPRRDDETFRAAMAGAQPLRGRRKVVAPSPSVRALLRERPVQPAPPPEPAQPARALPDLSPERSPGLDRATAQTLRRGRLQPDGTIDLHGMTVAQAERALGRALARAQEAGWRSLLVVTGKGRELEDGTMRGGRIRAHFLTWINLAQNRVRVHAVRQAHPRHGGSGAYYLLLRRAGRGSGT